MDQNQLETESQSTTYIETHPNGMRTQHGNHPFKDPNYGKSKYKVGVWSNNPRAKEVSERKVLR